MSIRLNNIISAVPQSNSVADVGCDHGYIGIALLEQGIAQNVCFIDISQPSLEKAKANCPKEFCDKAQFVCRNGLGDIVTDCAVIAGMGGLEIISVLQNAVNLPQKIVLQPMKNLPDVRRYIAQQYEILSDQMFFDGKFYNLIVATKHTGGCKLTQEEVLFGKTNLKNPSQDFIIYLDMEIQKYSTIYEQCRNNADMFQRLQQLRQVRCGIKEKQQ